MSDLKHLDDTATEDRFGESLVLERTPLGLHDEAHIVRSPTSLSGLTRQELQVALCIADGLRNREAARELFISPKTVEHHLTKIYSKLGLRSRSELVRLVLRST
jgi:DNA-binding CsgD family transcriptional regulator